MMRFIKFSLRVSVVGETRSRTPPAHGRRRDQRGDGFGKTATVNFFNPKYAKYAKEIILVWVVVEKFKTLAKRRRREFFAESKN